MHLILQVCKCMEVLKKTCLYILISGVQVTSKNYIYTNKSKYNYVSIEKYIHKST